MEADGRDYKGDTLAICGYWMILLFSTVSVLPVGEGCSEVPGDEIRGAPSTALVPQPSFSVTNRQLVPAAKIDLVMFLQPHCCTAAFLLCWH